MTWHLKDRELEKKLTELCSYFLETLNYGVYSKRDDENYIFVSFDRDKSGNIFGSNDLWFWMDELEEVPEYNPHTWNLYPEVTPPQGAMMRIKYHDVTSKDRKVERGFALFDCGQWVSDSGYPKFPNNPQNYVIWFRPWIGPDEEGEE